MIAIAAGALITVLVSPSPSPPPSVEVETGAAHETLTGQHPAWDSQYFQVTMKDAERQTFYVQLSSNQRFGKDDDQVLIGVYVPVAERWAATAEATASNTHAFLPSASVYGGVQYASGGGYLEGIAVRHTDYDSATVNSATVSLEHYWRNYRLAYTVIAARLSGTGTDVEQSAEADRYYGRLSSYVGAGYTAGREVDNIGAAQIVASRVYGWNVSGKQWITDAWGVSYGAGSFVQGSFYTRTGGRLAIDYRF